MKPEQIWLATTIALLAGTAAAQTTSSSLQPITSPVKDAGTYHFSTGTWTRAKGSVALAGPEVLYSNTCTTGYYSGLNGQDTLADSGRIPSTQSGGLYDNYEINGFSISYCATTAGTIQANVAYWDCYEACSAGGLLTGLTPVAAFSLLSLPAGGPSGSAACWFVSLDLTNTTLTFNLGGDCDGVYQNVGTLDSFGWGIQMPISPGTSAGGPIMAGDPANAINPACGGVGDGTTFPGFNPALAGTGIGNIDQWELQSVTVPSGCYWFGGYSGANGSALAGSNPWSGFYHELRGDTAPGCNCGGSTCDCSGGNGPCFTASGFGRGCPNSNPNGLGAAIVASGNPSISADTFGLSVVDAAPAKPGLVFAGTTDLGPFGIGTVPDNSGVLCVGGTTSRGAVVFTDATGAASLPTFQGLPYGQSSLVSAGSAISYTYWFRDPGSAFGCLGDTPAADFNFSNGWTVTWLP